MRSTIALMGVGKLPSIELNPQVPAILPEAGELSTHQYPIGITHQLRLLLSTHHACLPANIFNQIGLHLTQRDFAVSICISITFHAFHQVVAENTVLEIWIGAGYLVVLAGSDDGKVLGK